MPLMLEPTNPRWISLNDLLEFVAGKKDGFGVSTLFGYTSSGKASYVDINSTDVWTGNLADQEAESAGAEVDAIFTALEAMEATIQSARDSTDMYEEDEH